MLAESTQLEWLVIVLVYNHQYIDDLNKGRVGYIPMEVQKNNLLHAIEGIEFNNSIKVIVVENRLHFAQGNEEIIVNETATILESTARMGLQTALKAAPTSELLSKSEEVKKLLIRLMEENASKRHVLVTFGHGSIFGINYVVSPKSLQPKHQLLQEAGPATGSSAGFLEAEPSGTRSYSFIKLKPNDKEVYTKDAGFDFASFFETHSKEELKAKVDAINKEVMLTNEELRDAILEVLKSTKKKKLDILVMYNCIMQNVYTQYALKDCFEFLVAPVSGICLPGYDYAGVFKELQQNPVRSTEDAAGLFLSTIKNFTDDTISERDINGTWKICCVKLDGTAHDSLKDNFTRLIEQMRILLSEPSGSLAICLDSTLNQCFNYAVYCLNNEQTQLDLFVFLKYLSEKIKDDFQVSLGTLIPFIDQVLASLSGIEVKSFIGSRIFNGASFVDQRYREEFGFGFLLQKRNYPERTIQRDTLASGTSPYFPAFLVHTQFEELFSQYAGGRNPIPVSLD